MLVNILLLLLGFVLLVKGADFLVNGASALAKKYHIRELAIGLTVVAFGTSAPELIVNMFAAADGYDEVVFGNIIGSNLFNILATLGIAGLIHPIKVQSNTVWREIPFSLFAILLFWFMVNDQLIWGSSTDILTRFEGIVLLFFFIAFMFYVFYTLKSDERQHRDEIAQMSTPKTVVYILLGLVGLSFGGKLVVDNAVQIAQALQVSEKMIGLTIVATGTSLPELVTSAVAAYHKRIDLAVGNIIGSNIFNILLVLALSGIVAPLEFTRVLNIDIILLVGATVFIFISMFTGGKKQLDRWEAALLVMTFVVYMVYLIIRQ